MSIARLIGRAPEHHAAAAAYVEIVARARTPFFYREAGVPDTLDGRFEMIALHTFLVLHRIRHEKSAERFGQALFDRMFADMDRGLREMGTGDLSVGKQVKQMATGFFGRVSAYQSGLEGDGDLGEALRRNLFGTVPTVPPDMLAWFVDYVAGEAAALARADLGEIVQGRIAFAPWPGRQHG